MCLIDRVPGDTRVLYIHTTDILDDSSKDPDPHHPNAVPTPEVTVDTASNLLL